MSVQEIGTMQAEEKAKQEHYNAGAHTVIYTKEDFVARVNEITGGKKLPIVYDSVGKDTFMKSLDCLQPRGLMVSFGNSSGAVGPTDLGILAQKGSLYVTRPTLINY